MKMGIVIIGTALTVALSGKCHAAPLFYDCDTPANNFSEVKVAVETDGLDVKGGLTPVVFRKGTYLPVANVRIASSDGKNFVSVRLIGQNGKSGDADIVLQSSTDGKLIEGSIGKVKKDDKVDFNISYNSPGRVTLTINGKPIAVDTNVAGTASLSMTCSTGQFKFTDVEWTNK